MAFQLNNIEKTIGLHKLKLKINKDYTKAYLEILPNKSLDLEDINAAVLDFPSEDEISFFLDENGICYGINYDSIEYIVKNKVVKATLIAEGKPPTRGSDAVIINHFDFTHRIKLNEDENGNIDFKTLNWFKQLKKGDIIATKVPAQHGIDGRSIKDEEILSQPGRDVNFKYGKNIEIDETGTKIYATCDGRLEYVDNKYFVNEVLTIDGDVDTSTGNINFVGDVVVNGDIKMGYTVNTNGSLEVRGVIEACDINVGKDLIVRGGIQGNEMTRIKVNGSVVCKFIENANVYAKANITSDFIIHSIAKSGGKIILNSKKSLIVGGEVVAKECIVSTLIGSNMGTKTLIVLGLDVERNEKLIEKKANLEVLNHEIKKLTPVIKVGKEMLKRGKMDLVKKSSFVKSIKKYNSLLAQMKELKDDIYSLELDMKHSNFSYLSVRQGIYPGVKVTIHNSSRYIKDGVGACKIYLKGREIAIEKG